jgi:hypothetical protein
MLHEAVACRIRDDAPTDRTIALAAWPLAVVALKSHGLPLGGDGPSTALFFWWFGRFVRDSAPDVKKSDTEVSGSKTFKPLSTLASGLSFLIGETKTVSGFLANGFSGVCKDVGLSCHLARPIAIAACPAGAGEGRLPGDIRDLYLCWLEFFWFARRPTTFRGGVSTLFSSALIDLGGLGGPICA